MNIKNKILLSLSRNILARNKIFKNNHDGEDCYIFGNGVSLKSMDLKKFNDRISIGCGLICLHNDIDQINLRYCLELHPFFYYPFWLNPYKGIWEKNVLGNLSKRMIKTHNNLIFFCNISNCFVLKGVNIYYLHHFGFKFPAFEQCELHGRFSFSSTTIQAMIGMAIYMGFKNAILVGCDYTHSPMRSFHFYEKGEGIITPGRNDYNRDFFETIADTIDITTLTISGHGSDVLKHVKYQDYFGEHLNYRENTEIIAKKYLDELSATGLYVIY